MSLEWINPPRTEYDNLRDEMTAVADELRKNPGVWARIATGVPRTDTRRTDLLKDFGIEVKHHYDDPRAQMFYGSRYDLYARAPKEAR